MDGVEDSQVVTGILRDFEMTKNHKLLGGFPRERFQFPSAALWSSFVL